MVLSFILIPITARAKIHEYETTHLKSMAGTGIGGVLAEECAFLNPAPLAFFNTASVYAQQDSAVLTSNNINSSKKKSIGFVMSDGNPSLSGSLSYVNQNEDIYNRKRWGLSFSGPVSEMSAFGMSYRKTSDLDLLTNITKNYYQSVFGVTHVIDEKLTLGIVAYDPFKSQGHETKAIVGIQYSAMAYISAAFDFGGDYNSQAITKTLFYRAALQIKALDDFYIRFGGFNDKLRAEKGNGYGLAWIQPRLSFELSLKNTTKSKDESLGTLEQDNRETSFSASMRF